MVHQEVILRNEHGYGKMAPPEEIGETLKLIDSAVCKSIMMAVEGRSTSKGRHHSWLKNASDIRFVDISGEDNTVLHFEAPMMGDAASVLYNQEELWPTIPEESFTGFDILGQTLHDITSNKPNSGRFDLNLLKKISGFGNVLNGKYHEIVIKGRKSRKESEINKKTIGNAKTLGDITPKPRMGRIIGRLDMIRWSTQSFEIVLKNGEHITGVLIGESIDKLKDYGAENVLVEGKFVYRPSGNVLRIDAYSATLSDKQPGLWADIPAPQKTQSDLKNIMRRQTSSTGVNAYFGIWPGDETEEELLALLEAE